MAEVEEVEDDVKEEVVEEGEEYSDKSGVEADVKEEAKEKGEAYSEEYSGVGGRRGFLRGGGKRR